MCPSDNMSQGAAPTVRKLVMTARPPDSKRPIKTEQNSTKYSTKYFGQI